MKLSAKSISKYIYGVVDTNIENGYLRLNRFTPEQIAVVYAKSEFCGIRTEETALVKFIAKTDATNIEVEYKFELISSLDTIECYVDGKLIEIKYVKDLAPVNKKGKVSFNLPQGEKEVKILFPCDATILLKSVTVNGYIKKAKTKKCKVLWSGDSITQGWGSFRAGETYTEIAGEILSYDTLNQGIGGYVYDADLVSKIDGYTPDKIIIAYGTNHYLAENFETEVEKYYVKLDQIFHGIPVLVITPIWRKESDQNLARLVEVGKIIQKITSKYPNIMVVDGFDLIPNLPEYFMDGLHPNALGMRVYGYELARKIKEIKF